MMVYVSTIIKDDFQGGIEYCRIGNVWANRQQARIALANTVEVYENLHGCHIVKEEETKDYSYVCVTNGRDTYHLEIFPRELL